MQKWSDDPHTCLSILCKYVTCMYFYLPLAVQQENATNYFRGIPYRPAFTLVYVKNEQFIENACAHTTNDRAGIVIPPVCEASKAFAVLRV